jgi:hypothetical protein
MKENPMANTPDYTRMMQDAAASMRLDTSKLQDAMRSSAVYGEQLSQVALAAAAQSAELSARWTRETLAKLGDVTKVKEKPEDYSKALSDFAQAQAAMMNDHMAAFAEIAKTLQTRTVEVMLDAARKASDETQEAVKSAAAGAVEATRKATPKA